MRLADIPFNPRYTPLAMETARGLLSSFSEHACSTANYCIVSDIGTVERHYGSACHRSISTTTLEGRSLVVTEAGWKRRTTSPLSRELAAVYADYIVNRFYAGRFVLDRDDPDEWLDGGFIVSCDAPAPLMQNFLIASRAFYEVNSSTFEKFRELLNKGINPDVAYIACFSTGASHPNSGFEGDGKVIEDGHPVTNGAGHRPHRLLPLPALMNMVRGETGSAYTKPLDGSDTHRTNADYRYGAYVFDDKGVTKDYYGSIILTEPTHDLVWSLFQREDFKAVLREYRLSVVTSETYRPPNPFAPKAASVRPDQLSHKEFYELAVPFINSLVTEDEIKLEIAA